MGSGLMAPILPLLLLLYCSFCGGGCCCRLGQRCGAARAAGLAPGCGAPLHMFPGRLQSAC